VITVDVACLSIILAVLGSFEIDLVALVVLVIIGVIIIALIKLLLILIPAGLVAFAVWYFTGNLLWTGIAFLVIAALSILKKL